MESSTVIGAELRKLRTNKGVPLVLVSEATGIDRAYLNKVELGSVKPTPALLGKLLDYYSVDGLEAIRLRQLAGHVPFNVVKIEQGKEETKMTEEPQVMQEITVNPATTPVLFTDSTFVNSTEYGLVLDIAQIVGGRQHNVVARVGMTFDHAKKLIQVMNDHIEKNER